MTITIDATDVIYAMDRNNPPVATAASGDRVVFSTLDCFSNAIRSDKDLVTDIDFSRINPATGPLFVTGAQPGDALAVHIESIELADHGTMIVAPGFGLFGGEITEPKTTICPVDDDGVHIGDRLVAPQKMIGVIGCAPGGEPVETGTPHQHGGNMDCRMIGENTTIYLPVAVPGALLAIGDVHAAMGDGEVGVSGVEIPAKVTVRVEVVKDPAMPLPFWETSDRIATLASCPGTDEAMKQAAGNMVDHLVGSCGMTTADAVMLLSAAGNLRVCQVVDPNITFRMELPKSVLEPHTPQSR